MYLIDDNSAKQPTPINSLQNFSELLTQVEFFWSAEYHHTLLSLPVIT